MTDPMGHSAENDAGDFARIFGQAEEQMREAVQERVEQLAAETLRKAAAKMREDWPISPWHLTVAGAVDSALTWFDPDDCTEAERAMHDALLAVAGAYLGEAS